MNFLRLVAAVGLACQPMSVTAAVLQAGAAKVDITDERGLVNDRLYARALALRSEGGSHRALAGLMRSA